ncbi:hypothetical protein IMY05_016G0142400 [Salix suchowensis]|nr:hypothetical protein IMY05_016G0142400 [Salix suchowensis]
MTLQRTNQKSKAAEVSRHTDFQSQKSKAAEVSRHTDFQSCASPDCEKVLDSFGAKRLSL